MKQKNWTQIEGFDRLHPMSVTEYDEYGGCVSSSSIGSYGFDNSPSYKRLDVDARIKFYNEMRNAYGVKTPLWLMKEFNKSGLGMFNNFLFVFCFGDMNEDFNEKIRKLEK